MTTYKVKTLHQEVEKTGDAIRSGDKERISEIKYRTFESLKDAVLYMTVTEHSRHWHYYHTLLVDDLEIPDEVTKELIGSLRLRSKLDLHRKRLYENINRLDIFNELSFTDLI